MCPEKPNEGRPARQSGRASPIVEVQALVNLPYVLHIDDGKYSCSFGKGSFIARPLLVQAPVDKAKRNVPFVIKPATGEVEIPGEFEVPGASNKYTELGIGFGKRASGPDISDEERQELTGLAHRFANAFLDSYRYVFGDTAVYPLSEAEFFSLRHGKGVRFHTNVVFGGKGKVASGTTFGPKGLTLRMRPNYPKEEQDRFRAFLESAEQPPVVDLLLLNADMYLGRGDFRLAVIEAGTALDIGVEDAALRLLLAQGKSRADAERELEPMSTKRTAETALGSGSRSSLLQTRAWQRYDADFRNLRNRVIHDGYEPVFAEAQDCLQVFRSIVGHLRTDN